MLYEAGNGTHYQIGLATSPDGLTWTYFTITWTEAATTGSATFSLYSPDANGGYCWFDQIEIRRA